MGLPFPLHVGLRYTRAKRRNHFISFIALISMFGIALGVTVLITVMSVMNGFERELRDRILGMAEHVVVTDFGTNLGNWQQVAEQVKDVDHVIATAPYVRTEAMFSERGANQYGMLQGILPEQQKRVSILPDNMLAGSLDDLKAGEYGIILGAGIARAMGANIGNRISVAVLKQTRITPAGLAPRIKQFTVVGIFEVKADFDRQLAFTHMEDAARLLRMGDEVTGLRVHTDDVLSASQTAWKVSEALGQELFVTDWTRTYSTLWRAIGMEKTMMFVLLTLVVAVAAFNIVSTLVMVVTEKTADIAILRTLGAAPKSIMWIFMIMGTINGLIGTLLGATGGVLLSLYLPDIAAWVESAFGVSLVPSDVYFIGFLPSQLNWQDVWVTCLAAFVMSLLATLYPAWKASRTQPAEALRYD